MTSPATLPLSSLSIIELHAIGPVPFAGMLLRQLGARVTRVSPPVDPGLGVAIDSRFDVLNAGKETVHLDLKSDTGRAALDTLLADADVMLEGFRPGVLERLGLAPQAVLEKHPKLVIGRLSGWGVNGPWAARAGHDINYLGLAGLLNAMGSAEQPAIPLNVVGDFGGGAMHLLVGVLSKLVERGSSGKGGVAQTSILAGSIGLSPLFFGLMAAGRWTTDRASNFLDGATPYYRVYPTADGRHVSVGAIEAKFYLELLTLTGLADRIDPADQHRRETWPETIALLAAAFASRPRDEWAALAIQRDCCVAPVLDFMEAASDPHNVANNWYAREPFVQTRPVIDFE